MTGTLDAIQESEERRDHNFRANEDDRERIFLENENRRDQEALQRRDELWRELEERLAALPPLGVPSPIPVPPPAADIGAEVPAEESPAAAETQSVIESIRTVAQDAATRHAQDILDTVRMEREELAHEREVAQAERERLQAEAAAAYEARFSEEQARVRALEEELAAVRVELENERQLRMSEEAERRERERMEMLERDEAMRTQLGDLTNIVSEQRDELARKREVMDERFAAKEERRQDKDTRWTELRDMVRQVVADREADRERMEEWRNEDAGKRSCEEVLEECNKRHDEHRDFLREMSDNWRNECAAYHERTVEAVRATATEQVPFNVQAYLEEFSKSLAAEVRMLLGEVGRLNEQKRTLEYEIGCLMTFKSKHGPGGEFDPSWKPTSGPCARDGTAPAAEAPPEAPPPPEEHMPARPGWRNVVQRPSRRSRRSQAAAPPPPEPPQQEVRPPVGSWSTWLPDPNFVPTPPTVEPTLLAPDHGSPGLFGPRSPRDTIVRH
ncbi:hypothetical protein B0H21DRAFT_778320 [Amylocystis lapponica]|nr:hypothetical protein B0H21DRAFT_778320 [Amylocystis lapponica]